MAGELTAISETTSSNTRQFTAIVDLALSNKYTSILSQRRQASICISAGTSISHLVRWEFVYHLKDLGQSHMNLQVQGVCVWWKKKNWKAPRFHTLGNYLWKILSVYVYRARVWKMQNICITVHMKASIVANAVLN